MVAYNQNLGMNPVKSLNDNPYSGVFIWYPITSGYPSNIFVGSAVQITTGAAVVATGGTGVSYLGSARAFKDFTTGGTGIVAPSANQGVVPTTIQQYWAANTVKPTGVQTYVAVQVDTNTLYDMQSNATDMASGFPITDLMLGANFSAQTGFAVGSGNTSTGFSSTQIKKVTGGITNLQIIALSPNNGNAWSTVNNSVLVKINGSQVNVGISL